MREPERARSVVFDRLVFGRHPYGRPGQGTVESIGRITREDLAAFHRQWFAPNNSRLAIVGDLPPAEAFAAAERAFGKWARRDVTTWSNFWFAFVLLTIVPAFLWWRTRSFEKSRWSTSDFSPYWSEDD